MHIILHLPMPNGSVAAHHRVRRIEIEPGASHVVVDSRAAGEDQPILWQQAHVLPASFSWGGDALQAAYDWLVSPAGALAGGELLDDPTPLEAARAATRARVKAKRDAFEASGALTPKGRVDTDNASLIRISGAVQAATLALSAGEPWAIEWTMADESVELLDAGEMIAVGLAAMAHVNACHERSRQLRAEIMAAENEADLAAVDIDSGWPGLSPG